MCFALRIAEASSTAHLDKVEHGYENMDHFKVDFRKESKALRTIDFLQGEGGGSHLSVVFCSLFDSCNYLKFILLPVCLDDDDDDDEDDEDGEANTEEAEGTQTGSTGATVTASSVHASAPQAAVNASTSTAKSAAST